MALKPTYDALNWETSFFANSTMERGYVVVAYTGTIGSGAAMDSFNQLVRISTSYTGGVSAVGSFNTTLTPIGVLWNTFVNKDLTQQTLNYLKHESQIGDKAAIITKGTVVTNAITAGLANPIFPGTPAYLGPTGTISNIQENATQPLIGKFLSRVDQDGYAKVYINL